MMRAARMSALGLAAAALIAVAGWAGYLAFMPPAPERAAETGAGVAIGGPFTLVDQTGRTVHDTDYRGRMMLISFGYTTCPDVCPTTLASISRALDQLGADAERVQPLFITIDPERDTPEALAAYVPHFHPSLIGLTGTPAQIAAVAKAYKVYYAKAGGAAAGEDYLMDHSTIVYLMGPDGRLLTYLPNATDPDALAARIREYF